jgi:hypothetical protein
MRKKDTRVSGVGATGSQQPGPITGKAVMERHETLACVTPNYPVGYARRAAVSRELNVPCALDSDNLGNSRVVGKPHPTGLGRNSRDPPAAM